MSYTTKNFGGAPTETNSIYPPKLFGKPLSEDAKHPVCGIDESHTRFLGSANPSAYGSLALARRKGVLLRTSIPWHVATQIHVR